MLSRIDAFDDPVHSVLVTLCHRKASERIGDDALRLLAEAGARRRLLDLAAKHRVSGLTLSALAESGRLAELGEGAADVDQLLRLFRRRAASVELELEHIVTALDRAGVRSVVLKGAALIGPVYGKAVERDLQDLDFLVPEEQLRRAVRIFVDHGYELPPEPGAMLYFRRHHFHVPVQKRGILGADVHWALDRPGAGARLDPQRFLDEAILQDRNGRGTIRVPRSEHMLLHLVQQNCSEGFGRLSRFVDIDRIVGGSPLDWTELVGGAADSGLGPATALSLRIAQLTFGTEVPRVVLHDLFPRSLSRGHVAMLQPMSLLFDSQIERTHARRHLVAFWMCDSVGERLRFLRRLLVAEPVFPPEKATWGLGARLARYPKMVLHQAFSYGRAAATMLTGRLDQMRFWSRKASRSERR